MSSTERILLVDTETEAQQFLTEALSEYTTQAYSDGPTAMSSLEENPGALIISTFDLGAMNGIDLIKACKEKHPHMKGILWAPYSDLPKIVSAGGEAVASRILPKPGKPENIRKIVAQLLTEFGVEENEEDAPSDAGQEAPPLDWTHAQTLLKSTALECAHIHERVVRPMADDEKDLQLQFVLPDSAGTERFRRDLIKHWHHPFKTKDNELSGKDKKHPVVQLFGGLWKNQELFVRQVEEKEAYIYVAFLPWTETNEKRDTVVIGIHTTNHQPEFRAFLERTHEEVVQELSQMLIPALTDDKPPTGGDAEFMPEYNWIVAKNYVGPDRRTMPTSLFNRFMFLGARKKIPQKLANLADAFVDRLTPKVKWFFFFYMLLAFVDMVFTYWFVRNGTVQELNPILRPLLHGYPWAFFLVKNLIVVTAFLLVARFQLFKVGKYVVPFTVFAYAFLDVYWLVLIGNDLLKWMGIS